MCRRAVRSRVARPLDGSSVTLRWRERAGDAEQRERGGAQARELPEPVEGAVHGPVGEARQRRGRDRARERIAAAAERCRGRQQRGSQPDEREQRADEARLD